MALNLATMGLDFYCFLTFTGRPYWLNHLTILSCLCLTLKSFYIFLLVEIKINTENQLFKLSGCALKVPVCGGGWVGGLESELRDRLWL